jgi:hypothetical protein
LLYTLLYEETSEKNVRACSRQKAEKKAPLNASIKKLKLYAGSKKNEQNLNQALEDIAGTCKTEKVEISAAKGKGREVKGYLNVRFRAEY